MEFQRSPPPRSRSDRPVRAGNRRPTLVCARYAVDQSDVQCIIILAFYADRTYVEIMDLRRLRTFVAVAELGTVSKAALRLRVGQPALSRQISDLQQELGLRLFDRI